MQVTAATHFGANDWLDLGSDLGAPVSVDYHDQAPFKFSGPIGTTKITYPKKCPWDSLWQPQPGNDDAMKTVRSMTILALLALTLAVAPLKAADPLPSWNDGPTKQAIIDFVAKVTKEGSPDFVPVDERIATFDNDGTLWCEQPMYFAVGVRPRPRQGRWPRSTRSGRTRSRSSPSSPANYEAAWRGRREGFDDMVMRTHAGMTTTEFERRRQDWLTTAKHPRFKRPYTELVYQPMLELLAYLRAQRLQDVHRLRRRHRVHAAVDAEGVRHPAGAGRRQQRSR